MIADLVRNIGGDYIQVTSLMGPGIDPHLYKASASDIRKLEDADVIFYNGLHLEGKMVEIFESLSERKKVSALADSIPEEKLLSVQQGSSQHDPHIWFDVDLWSLTIDGIVEVLSDIDSEHTVSFVSNAQEYKKQLSDLGNFVRTEVARIPRERRVMVTSHDAFRYFGRAYDVDVVGIQGISTASDYGLKDLERVIDTIITRNVRSIFIETSVSKKSIQAVQEGVRSKGHEITIGGEMFGDALGNPGTPEGTYIGMIRHNVETLLKGLL
jgi:manganese/zinc/iron transport system substrate-binding protein